MNGLNVLDVEHDGFAGHVTPATAWGCLAENGDAILVDVRTQAEWAFVGLPDLTDAAARLVCMEWVEEAIASGSKDDATSALRAAQPLITKAGRKGLVHKRAASRKVSRLAKRVAAIS